MRPSPETSNFDCSSSVGKGRRPLESYQRIALKVTKSILEIVAMIFIFIITVIIGGTHRFPYTHSTTNRYGVGSFTRHNCVEHVVRVKGSFYKYLAHCRSRDTHSSEWFLRIRSVRRHRSVVWCVPLHASRVNRRETRNSVSAVYRVRSLNSKYS